MRTFLSNTIRKVFGFYWTSAFRSICKCSGSGLVVKGAFYSKVSGDIIVGNNLMLDSNWSRPDQFFVGKGATLIIGSDVYLNYGVNITCNISMSIGDRCLLAPEVSILDDNGHPTDWRIRHGYKPGHANLQVSAPVIIENDVWIGMRAIILKGVTIGEGSVIGAGSVVTRSIPRRVLAAGIPAKVIKEI